MSEILDFSLMDYNMMLWQRVHVQILKVMFLHNRAKNSHLSYFVALLT